MIFNHKRSELEIVFDILKGAGDASSKTQLQYASRLSYHHFESYFSYLLSNEFLVQCDGSDLCRYQCSEKGESVVRNLSAVFDAIV